MNSFFNKLKRKSGPDNVSLGSNSSIYGSGLISVTPYTVNEKQLPPFLKSIWKNDLSKVKKLMKKNYNQVDSDKRTGFHLACAAGHLDIIKELITNYCNELLEKRDINNKTGLYKAVEKGIYENVQYLLEKGAKTEIKDDKNESLIHAAIRNKHEIVLQYLLHKETSFHEANADGNTPLHLAAELNFINGIKMLLKYPCDIDVLNGDGKTALIIATECGHHNTVEFLLTNNADQTISDNKGFNALHYASFHQNMECIALLQRNEDYKLMESSQKPQFTLEAPEFLATIPAINGKSNDSLEKNGTSQYEPKKSKTTKSESKLRGKKSDSQDSIHSNSSWMGDFTNTSSGATIPPTPNSAPIHDISTPSSMPNPSDIVVNPSKSMFNLPRKKTLSEDEESQWSDYDKSHQTSSQHVVKDHTSKNHHEKGENKSEIISNKLSDSEWDSDDTEQQGNQVDLSTIDEESAGKRSRMNSLQVRPFGHGNHHNDQDSSDLSVFVRQNQTDDDHQTDSNIEELYDANYIVTNPPVNYENEEDDSEFDVLNELCTTQISNINYKNKSLLPSSKPPKSPSINTVDKNVPTITVEEFKLQNRTKPHNQAAGDNLSYSSNEFDMLSRQGSVGESDSLNGFHRHSQKSIDDYIMKYSHLQSRYRSLESERDGLLLNLNSIKELKEKSESERLKIQMENQKLEAALSEKIDELSDFKSRIDSAQDQLQKREKELFEIQRSKQDIEDRYNQLEIGNVALNSKVKQHQQEIHNLQLEHQKIQNNRDESLHTPANHEEELKKINKSNDELKLQISKLEDHINQKDNEFKNMSIEHNSNTKDLKKQISNLQETVKKESEDKDILQEEIDQLRKTIKDLNYDLESSNKSTALVSKQERENSDLKGRIQDMEKKYSQLLIDKENLTRAIADNNEKFNDFQLKIEKLENQLKLKEEKLSNVELQYKTFETQSKDLERLLEKKNSEMRDYENKLINAEVELKKESKSKENVLELVDDAIDSAINNYPNAPQFVENLQALRHSINNCNSDNVTPTLQTKPVNHNIDLSIELSKAKSQIRVLQDQIEKMKNDQITGIKESQSQYSYKARVELERIERLEKMDNEIHTELHCKSTTIQNHQQSMEISQLSNKATVIEENRDSLIQQNKLLNETLAKERQLKDALTEQLIQLVKTSHGSNPQIYGNEPNFQQFNGFSNYAMQFKSPTNVTETEKKGYANSMFNLSVVKSVGMDDDDLRQKLRQELDRSIAKHLESGKPIRQLNIKDKIRSLNIGRYPISTVSWKSP